jgi:phosphoglycerate kinase
MGLGMNLPKLSDLKGQIAGKRVLVRVNYDLPLRKDGSISDIKRIEITLPTIRFLSEEKAKIILMSHMGRPEGADEKLSLRVAADKLEDLLNRKVIFVKDCIGNIVRERLDSLNEGDILLLENLRFHPEEKSDHDASSDFSRELASFGDVYVNEAFANCHRKDASMLAVPRLMRQENKPAVIGFSVQKELDMLSPLLNPESPSLAIIGGAKVKDKITIISTLVKKFDRVLIGGGMANTFLSAIGRDVGNSRVEEEFVDQVKELLKSEEGKKILLPPDVVTGTLDHEDDPLVDAKRETVVPLDREKVLEMEYALDIGPETVKVFGGEIQKARTIFWNGPMGVFESKDFREGTLGIAKAMADNEGYRVVGGGDSAAAVQLLGFSDRLSWVSSGGGAAQEFVQSDGHLVALEVLSNAP